MDPQHTSPQSNVAKPKATPRDVFMHLLAIGTLYASAVSLIALLFEYVNRLLPDPLAYYDYGITDAVRRSVSILIVVFPVFVWLTRFLERAMRAEPEKRGLAIRRWLVHLTLFVAAITIIVDLVTLVYNFLGGELSMRFFLKVLAVLAVAAAVFGYYLLDLKREGVEMPKRMRRFAQIASGIACVVIVGGFFIAGSPKNERLRKFDTERVSSLQTIQQELINYWQRKEKLPDALSELKNDISGFVPPQDPETNAPYEYRRTGDLSFELCATFSLPLSAVQDQKTLGRPTAPYAYPGPYQQNWDHAAGRSCFMRTIDPALYKPEPRPIK